MVEHTRTDAPDGFFHRIWHKEWPVVRGAPVSFVICSLLCSAVAASATYWFVDHLYGGTINQKDATLRMIEEERDRSNRENEKLLKQIEALRIYRGNDQLPLKKKVVILAKQIRDFTKDW